MSMRLPRFITGFFDPPRRFSGGLALNLFGYHLLRILSLNVTVALRRKRSFDDPIRKRVLETIMRDGVVVIPDCFPEDVFRMIKEECATKDLAVFNERAPRILRSAFIAEGKASTAPVLEKHLAQNRFNSDIVSAVLRQDVSSVPTVQVERSWAAAEDIGKPTTDKQDNLHFDVCYPTMKCFLYLNDVDASNAAFSYVFGSQRMTWARAWMEHVMGLKFWFWNKADQMRITPEVPAEFIEARGMKVVPLEGKANTLIIANTMGFHRRGQFSTTTPREMIIVNYRGMASLSGFKKKYRAIRAAVMGTSAADR